METAHWFRWHHGCVTDPKFRVIALHCVTSVTVGQVIAIWAAMLECASQATPRGELVGWSDEDVAVLFGFSEEQVSGIREAMQGKTLEGNRLIAWGARQPARNDDSKDRVREFRARQRDVTQGNAGKRSVTLGNARGEEIREEKKDQKQEHTAPRKKRASTPLPADFVVSDRVKAWAATKGFTQLDEHCEAFRAKCEAKGYTYADWDSAFMEAVREDWARLRTPRDGQQPQSGTPRRRRELGT